jgi:hypothetical protein
MSGIYPVGGYAKTPIMGSVLPMRSCNESY